MPDSQGRARPSYDSVRAAGIVVDLVTLLEWQAVSAPNELDLVSASSYCASLKIGEFNDFRLPTRVELASLLQYDRLPAIDTAAFPDMTASRATYWAADGFYIDFTYGNIRRPSSGTPLYWVRCVRQPANSISAGTPATSINRQKLAWRTPDGTRYTHAAATSYCTNIGLGGELPELWRLPTAKELIAYPGDITSWSGTDGQSGGGAWQSQGKIMQTDGKGFTWPAACVHEQ